VANQKKVLVEKLADKFQKKQMFFKAECCASGRIYSGSLRINSGSGIILFRFLNDLSGFRKSLSLIRKDLFRI
jgi:hypothetical protein